MDYIISYDYATLMLMIIIILFYHQKFKNSLLTTQGYLFFLMCTTHFLTTIFDIFISHPVFRLLSWSKIFMTINTIGFFLTHNALPFFYVAYIMALTKGVTQRVIRMRLIIPFLFSSVLILLSPITNWIFYIDEQGIYYRGEVLPILYIISFGYLIIGFLYLNYNRKILLKPLRLSLQYAFPSISICVIIIQIFYPEVLIEGFGIALCMLLLYFTIEDPESIIDDTTGACSNKAFLYDTALGFKNRQEFYMISITIGSQDTLLRTLGIDFLNEMRKQIVDFVKQIRPLPLIYVISNQTFCLLFPKKEVSDISPYIKEIQQRFEKPFSAHLAETYIEAVICLFECPDDVSKTEHIMNLLTHIEKKRISYKGQLLYAKDLDLNMEQRQQKIRHAIKQALRKQTFQIYYQPIYSTTEKKIISAEALIRLQDEELGFISPEEFIPLAEEDGSILEIGDYVLESVCRFIKENNLVDLGISYIEINVSVIQCMHQDLPEKVLEMIRQYNLEPSVINLEITETATADLPKLLFLNMEKLLKENVTFSLDDYGTGLSTIGYIIDLPFRIVKLDKSIIWSAFKKEKARIVLEHTIAMIRNLQMKIVAEGVETEQQAHELTKMGVEYLQGYYYSKPIPEQDFLQYLKMFSPE